MQLPAALVGAIGATTLGITLLRRGARPKLAAVLLLMNIPFLFAISMVTSLGNTDIPTMFAIALLARETAAPRTTVMSRQAATQTG